MEVFVLTQAGREMIPSLHKAEREEEAKILEEFANSCKANETIAGDGRGLITAT